MRRLLEKLDLTDPIHRAYWRYYVLAIRAVVILVTLLVVSVIWGVPHVQTSYRKFGIHSPNGWMPAEQKVVANYVSITGWERVTSGQYGQRGCPMLLFIPLTDCIFDGE